MTSRPGSRPSTKVLGARLVPPTSSVRRVAPSGESSPNRAGSSRNALARLLAMDQPPPQGGVDGHHVAGDLAGQAQRRNKPFDPQPNRAPA